MKFDMFRTVRLSTIRSLFTVHSAMVCVIQVCRQLSSRTRIGTCYSVQLTVWYAGAYAPTYQTVSYKEYQVPILVLLESCLQTSMTHTIAECTVNKLLMTDRRNCPEHVEFHDKINLWNWCI